MAETTDNSWMMIGFIGIIAGIALGIGIAILLKKNNTPTPPPSQDMGMMYSYDDQNRLQSVIPMSNSSLIRLRPMP